MPISIVCGSSSSAIACRETWVMCIDTVCVVPHVVPIWTGTTCGTSFPYGQDRITVHNQHFQSSYRRFLKNKNKSYFMYSNSVFRNVVNETIVLMWRSSVVHRNILTMVFIFHISSYCNIMAKKSKQWQLLKIDQWSLVTNKIIYFHILWKETVSFKDNLTRKVSRSYWTFLPILNEPSGQMANRREIFTFYRKN